jgi:CheY-like chemotaxis protein
MKKVLLIEDEAKIAEVFRKQLTLIGGHEVDVASDGKEALGFLESNEYNIILTDLVMPGMDGIEFMENLHEDESKKEPTYSRAPIIVLTNVTSPETKDQVKKLGAVDFIVKTDVDPDVLIRKIEEHAK